MCIRGLVHLIGLYALWQLWGVNFALFGVLLTVMVLEWLCAQAVRESVRMHQQDPGRYPAHRYAKGGAVANFWVYCTMVLSLVTVGLVIAAFLVT